jgi:cell division protein FtsW
VRRSDDLFVKIAAGGVTVWIVGQGLVNIGVVLRIFPPLGVPLPFLSSGGSALIAVLLACGVLLACARTLPQRGETAVPSRARIEG